MKTINLTESDLINLIKKTILESQKPKTKLQEYYGGRMRDLAVPEIDSIINKLENIKNNLIDSEGVYNRKDIIKIEFIDGLLKGKDLKLLLKIYAEQMKYV